MASMGRARGAADAVDGCCDVDASAVACAGGASLAATGGACCIDAFSPAAGEAAELEAAEALMAAAQMLVRYGLQLVSTAQLISAFCVPPGALHAQMQCRTIALA